VSPTEVILEGTLQADGTLILDEKPNLPPGRVMVILRREAGIDLPGDDPFWQRMQAIWAIPTSAASAADGGANTLAEVRKMREEWEEHQQALERAQDEGRSGSNPERPKP